MPLQLPNLDDRRYNDLVAEALARIPTYSPEWTNYNPSDPGITLLELFAYFADMLLYRLNRVTDANTRKFLKLLNAADWETGELRDEIRKTVLGVRERYRAVTKDDYEYLSTESFNNWLKDTHSPVNAIARAHCVPQRNLEAGTEDERLQPRPEHVSVVIVPAVVTPAAAALPTSGFTGPQPSQAQIDGLLSFLDERRMLTTKLHVVGPFYVHVNATLLIARNPDAVEEDLRNAIKAALAALLSPLPSDGSQGWPFGRDVFVSDIYRTLETIPGLDFVADVALDSKPTDDGKCVVAAPIWHADGDLIGLTVEQHHLAVFESADIVIAANAAFVSVELSVSAQAPANPYQALVKRTIKATLSGIFHPSSGGPGPTSTSATDIFVSDIELAVKTAAGLANASIVANCVPASILRIAPDRGKYIHVEAGKVVNWRTTIELD
jgi:hypothetical protein